MKAKQTTLKTCILFLILTIPGTASLARGTATMMGNLQTVSTDGPFDAIRNPAAMAFGGTSAGINFFFSPWADAKTTEKVKNISVVISGTPVTILGVKYDPNLDKKTVMTQEFATTIRMSDTFSLGLGVTALYKNQENSIIQSFTTPATLPAITESNGMMVDNRNKETVYTTYFSLGIQLTKTISMGYNLNFSIGNEETDRLQEGFTQTDSDPIVMDGSPWGTHNSMGNISGEISAYFMHKTGNHQTGVNLYSGTYSWIDYSAEIGGFSLNTDFAGSYSSGASLVAGHYWRFSPLLAAAFEAGVSIPVKYTPYSYNNTALSVSVKETELNGLTILASTGIEINPLKKLTTSLGLTYINTRGGSRSISSGGGELTDSTTNFTINVVKTTAGAQYTVFSGMEINFTASLIWIGSAAEQETLQSSSDFFFYTIATDTNTLQLDFSVSFVKRI